MAREPNTNEMNRWWKTDFHTHSPASRDTHMEGVSEADWLMAFMEAGIDVIAITDHNTGLWIDQVKMAYTQMERELIPGFRPLTIFPGVEITTGDGVHLLALFDLHQGTETIESLLDDIGSPHATRGEASCYADAPIHEIIHIIERNNGVAIPAHIDRKRGKGIFCLDQNHLSRLIQSGSFFVVESSGDVSDWMTPYQNNPHRWAVIAGSDTHTLNPDDPISRTPGSIFTRIYMKRPTFDNLSIAFHSGKDFICREINR